MRPSLTIFSLSSLSSFSLNCNESFYRTEAILYWSLDKHLFLARVLQKSAIALTQKFTKKASKDTTFQKKRKIELGKSCLIWNVTLDILLKHSGYQVDQLENELFLDKKSDKSKYARHSLCSGKISWSLR